MVALRSKKLIFLFTALLLTLAVQAQTQLLKPVNIGEAYQNGTRSDTGKPGPKYWQNTAQYHIQVAFVPATRQLKGTVEVDYINNSPDTLSQLFFKLYPNLYKKGVIRDSYIQPVDLTDGVNISNLTIAGKTYDDKSLNIQGTNMRIQLAALILPGQKVHCSIAYSYTLNKTSHQRTGQVDEGSYFIAYFFPRIAVYDDIDGWNKYPYLGSQEFYNDFCDFDVQIILPANYVVWATGELKNQTEVFSKKIAQRIDAAVKKDSVTNIITQDDVKAGNVTLPGKLHTWQFKASNVTDFAFATSNHYIWQAASLVVDPATGRRTRVDAVFNPIHKSYYRVIGYARKTVEAMSYTLPKWPYPYPHETVFDGLDQMEYPMMVNDNPVENSADDIELTDHEIFHTMFPFYMGVNETKYGWMDEGWATLGEWLISPMIDPSISDDYGIDAYASSAGTEEDQPVMTLTTQLKGATEFTNSYPKPAMGYLYVKDMLGDALFTKALHYYIENWHGKHPGPFDFFNCINAGSGRNLNWFWQRWFFDGGVPDLAISKVTDNGAKQQVLITSVGTKPVPIDLNITYTDGSTQTIHRDVACWEKGNKNVLIDINASKKIKQLTLGSVHIPDANKKDNSWIMPN